MRICQVQYHGDIGLDRFYRLEGWNPDNGWPTRKTLEGMGMNKVADTLAGRGKLGA